jgi:hypothetical protein
MAKMASAAGENGGNGGGMAGAQCWHQAKINNVAYRQYINGAISNGENNMAKINNAAMRNENNNINNRKQNQ